MTLLDVAGGNVTGPPPVAPSLNVSVPGPLPAATVQVHSKTTGSSVPEMSSSALVSTGPVSVEQDAPAVGATVRFAATTLLTALLDSTVKVVLTVSPVTTRDRDASSSVNRPCGLTPGAKTSAPPWPVAAVNGASTTHLLAAML